MCSCFQFPKVESRYQGQTLIFACYIAENVCPLHVQLTINDRNISVHVNELFITSMPSIVQSRRQCILANYLIMFSVD
jgi:hypothetical protein